MDTNRSGEMEVFVQVVQSGSFAAAARRLEMTPSAVAKLIQRLESRLGARLINRTTRSFQPTAEGRLFFDRAQVILADLEDAESAVGLEASEPQGVLRLNVSVPFGRRLLLPLLPEFLALHPRMRVDLTLTDELIDPFEQHTDLVIRHGALADSRLIARYLGRSPQLIVASPDYLARRGEPRTPAELIDHDCIDFNFRRQLSEWRFTIDGEQRAVPVSGSLSAGDGETLRELTLAGVGISRLTRFHVLDDIRRGALVSLLEPFASEDSDAIHALYHDRRHLASRTRAMLDFLTARLHLD
ncbi:LysR family transcriptional regulator [Halotalea alkalilenta]|uniref:LysR family transcriptional regulator n=1 Tax=Halotalea alkalilenta TaxID=376489 RepID=UPI00047F84DF|nr:LysR family transcriptional regulator [Halotalea alkalilenta]